MGKYTEKLINIFSKCDTNKLSENQEYCEFCHTNKDQKLFDRERNQVHEIKELLEETVGIQTSTKRQVIQSLHALNETIIGPNSEEDINICYELIMNTYSNQWTKNQLAHFQKYYYALKNNYDYFLSFTDRRHILEEDNIINKRYEFLIRKILGPNRFDNANQKENLLARAIHYELENRSDNVGNKGFFYPEKQGDNQAVKTKLKNACERSFVFIQIVQNIMFVACNDPNYCFFEYECASKSAGEIKENQFFLLAEISINSIIQRRNVFRKYIQWHQEVLDMQKIHLEPTENYDQDHISNQLNKIRNDLVDRIDQIKWKIIEDVPD